MDIPKEGDLVGAGLCVDEIEGYIGVDSLGYLSTAGLGRAINSGEVENVLEEDTAKTLLHNEFCYGCMEKSGTPFDPSTGENTRANQFVSIHHRDILMRTP